jgi:glutathione-regulated potassium-efflux system ancillary protein KefC
MSVLSQMTIFLSAAVIAAPITKWLGFGAVLGYLVAGMILGPWGLGVVREVGKTLHLAEFGVVLLLFVIGLELHPKRLRVMRNAVFGLGGAQVLVTSALLAIAAFFFGLSAQTSLVVGLALSMSSTAFALQILAEKNQLTAHHGRAAFGVLLFQDLAVIPVLALLPLLGGDAPSGGELLLAALKAFAVLAAIVIGGHYLLRPMLRLIAATRIQEAFTAMTLLTVVGTALLMQIAGLSMALGAFLAGVLLADSEYRHELEADIEPFKGLLLGLFFIAVGMSVNLGLVIQKPLAIAGLVLALILLKTLVLFGLGKWHGLSNNSARSLAVAISQGGEFAFVLLGVAVGDKVIDQGLADLLIVVVTLSMAATPLLFLANEALLQSQEKRREDYDTPAGEENPVIIAGFGRFGQIVARILLAKRIGFTALDISPERVDFVRQYGDRIYYGDASRLDLLRAARADQAKIFVLAIDDVEASLRTAETVKKHFPNLTIYARARNRRHAYRLLDLGITNVRRETLLSSIDMARVVLMGLGVSKLESEKVVRTFQEYDERQLIAHHAIHADEEKMVYLAQEAAKELEGLFEQDAREQAAMSDGR